MNFRKVYLFILLFICLQFHAQVENSQWYFGTQAGLNFLTNPPTILTNGVMSTGEGCASLSDATGSILFYTDGSTIYNKTHAVMANGTGLTGNSSTTQSGLIARQPGSNNLIYVFSLGAAGFGTLAYSIVDMNLAAGNGSVITKNVVLSTGMSEKLTSVRHCNGVDTWIVSHTASGNTFKSYLLTSTGVTQTVTTGIGSSYAGIDWAGNLKISANGRRLGAALGGGSGFNLFDFDPATGVPSNFVMLPLPLPFEYGCEFSPDGTKFYGCTTQGMPYAIYQWNLCAGSSTAIVASCYTLSTTSQLSGMQLAIDGKIYVSRYGQNVLGVIQNPNALGIAMNYNHSGQSLGIKTAQYNLPNFIVSGFKPPLGPITYSANNFALYGCQTAWFAAPPLPNTTTLQGCTAAGYSVTGLLWNFGDPNSGPTNTSTATNPTHVYSAIGTFTTTLIIYNSCMGGVDTLKQVVNITQPCISVSSSSITCANLGSATVTAQGGVGPYSFTWTPTAQTGSVVSGLSPGGYTITVHDFGNNSTYTASTYFLPLVPLTGTINKSSNINCFGANTGTGSVTNLSGGSGNQNYNWSNGTNSYTTAFTNSLSAGIWSISVIDALTGCSIFQTFYISQPSQQTLVLASNNSTACVNTSLTLSASNSGGTPFLGTAPYTFTCVGLANSSTATVSQSVAGTYIYSVTALDSLNCLANDTIIINFIGTPTLSASDVSICPLATASLQVSGASSYTWNYGASTGSVFVASPTVNTQYTVVGMAQTCTAAVTPDVTILPTPSPTILTNAPLCQNTNLTLNALGAQTYVWTGPQSYTANASSITIPQITLAQAGVYQVTLTAANTCTAATTISVTVFPTPSLSAIGSTVCNTQTLTLSGSASPGCSYQWIGPLGFTSTNASTGIATPNLNRSGVYSLIVISADGCTNQTTTSCLVLPPPTLSVALSSTSLCADNYNTSPNTITLNYSGASSYTLQSPYLVTPPLNGAPVTCTANATFTSPTLINNAVLIGSNGYCSSTTTFSVMLIANPTVTVSPTATAICVGKQTQLSVSGATNYQWLASGSYTQQSNNTQLQVQPIATSTYGVIGEKNGCYSSTKSSSVTVHAYPVFLISPATPTTCLNVPLQLSANGNGSSYQWYPSFGLNTTSGNSVTATIVANQVYTVIASLNNCTTAATTSVTVFVLPQPTITCIKNKVCENDTIHLIGSGAETYVWRGPMQMLVTSQHLSIKALNAGFAGVYTLSVTDKNGCKNNIDTNVIVYALPDGDITPFPESVCVPYCSNYQFISNPKTDVICTWSVNGMYAGGTNFFHCLTQPDTYTFTARLTNTSTSCNANITRVLIAYPKPTANFMFVPLRPIEELDEVVFSNTTEGAGLSDFRWYIEGADNYDSKNKNTSYLFQNAGLYRIVLVAKNQWQCADTIVKAIKVESNFVLYVPNSFTPNNDGTNDLFYAVAREVKFFEMRIYDRWGTEVFHSTSVNDGWQGTFAGSDCKQDEYTWVIELTNKAGERIQRQGNVLLLR